MKRLAQLLIFSLFSLNSFFAFAGLGSFSADIYNMNLHPSHTEQNILGAKVFVDADNGQITLSLQPAQAHCPANMYCPAVIPQALYIVLPMVDIQQDECGNIHYMGELESNFQFGLREQIMVSDNSQNRCPSFREMAPTEVNYVTVDGESNKYNQSILFGQKLNPEIDVMPVGNALNY